MQPYFADNLSTIYCGDALVVMPTFEAERFTTVITDPPYELGFMGKTWDSSGVAFKPETWSAVMRVCKPGAILLAFGGTRTFHRLTCAIEDGGWEIRDCMMWLYGSGFPKSLDISKAIDKAAGAEREFVAYKPSDRPNVVGENGQSMSGAYTRRIESAPTTDAARLWSGYGTALKPAFEPIIVAMKPLDGTFAENAQKHGAAGMNIDGGRIDLNGEESPSGSGDRRGGAVYAQDEWTRTKMVNGGNVTPANGRWPTNVILDESAAAQLDEQSGESGPKPARIGVRGGKGFGFDDEKSASTMGRWPEDAGGGASRFFYTAKASKSDRGGRHNTHATVKPTSLLKYLVKLTAMPTGGEILDPFGGSMTTLVAAREFGRPAVAIELEEEHCRIGVKRLEQSLLFGSEVA